MRHAAETSSPPHAIVAMIRVNNLTTAVRQDLNITLVILSRVACFLQMTVDFNREMCNEREEL